MTPDSKNLVIFETKSIAFQVIEMSKFNCDLVVISCETLLHQIKLETHVFI